MHLIYNIENYLKSRDLESRTQAPGKNSVNAFKLSLTGLTFQEVWI